MAQHCKKSGKVAGACLSEACKNNKDLDEDKSKELSSRIYDAGVDLNKYLNDGLVTTCSKLNNRHL